MKQFKVVQLHSTGTVLASSVSLQQPGCAVPAARRDWLCPTPPRSPPRSSSFLELGEDEKCSLQAHMARSRECSVMCAITALVRSPCAGAGWRGRAGTASAASPAGPPRGSGTRRVRTGWARAESGDPRRSPGPGGVRAAGGAPAGPLLQLPAGPGSLAEVTAPLCPARSCCGAVSLGPSRRDFSLQSPPFYPPPLPPVNFCRNSSCEAVELKLLPTPCAATSTWRALCQQQEQVKCTSSRNKNSAPQKQVPGNEVLLRGPAARGGVMQKNGCYKVTFGTERVYSASARESDMSLWSKWNILWYFV
ncbi:uncharacterized protein LOC120325010 [Pipra filicauda]|uniref:Uncharacterized protein LOC120325010 n=1 Tax=Pipra filicauda TaxID=649802 RepID=A0A7R5L5V9_9PASS|nr:uncharacterized protein LOC120325010 [Pipra filicauda]